MSRQTRPRPVKKKGFPRPLLIALLVGGSSLLLLTIVLVAVQPSPPPPGKIYLADTMQAHLQRQFPPEARIKSVTWNETFLSVYFHIDKIDCKVFVHARDNHGEATAYRHDSLLGDHQSLEIKFRGQFSQITEAKNTHLLPANFIALLEKIYKLCQDEVARQQGPGSRQ